MNSTKLIIILALIAIQVEAHVPFLKPNQFQVKHNRLQIESSFTEYPFQADFAMSAPYYWLIAPNGTHTELAPTAKTPAAWYLTPQLPDSGTYRIYAGVRVGPKYKAVETTDGKLYFAEEMKQKQGKATFMQYYSGADTYIQKGAANYHPQVIGKGVEIIPQSSPCPLHPNETLAFKVYNDGQTVPNARVVVVYDNEHYLYHRTGDLYDVENIRKNNIHANAAGEFSFTPAKTGLVVLFVTIHKKLNPDLWESYNSTVTMEVSLP